MADWNVGLPAEAVEGAATHVEDHNKVVDAIKEVRTNVDTIELAPGPPGEDGAKGDKGDKGEPGKDAEPQFTEEEVAALKALIETPEA